MAGADTPRAFPFHVATPGEALEVYAQLRSEEPVARVRLPGGHTAWLLTRYEDVRTALTDPRFSKQAATAPDAPRLLPIHRGSNSLVTMDPPDHTRLRRLVSGEFTQRRMAPLRPRVREIAAELVDDMLASEGGTADALTALALPLPIRVICELLGIPVHEQDRFRRWSDGILLVAGGGPTAAADAAGAQEAARNLMAYLGRLIATKREVPGDDLLTRLLRAQEEDDALSVEELLTFAMTLLVAGYHTTTAAISHLLLHLLDDPSRYAALLAAPEGIPAAVEEALRYSQVASGFGSLRIATGDVKLGGVTVSAGEAVIPLMNSANRDASVFPDPDRMQLDREHNQHLAFGAGIHFCLGAPLARIELQVLLEALVQRGAVLRLADSAQNLTWQLATAFPRPERLDVRW
ncbi:cytochrome P450 [Streptomyces morookaense]|uniref:Cytochrome P450 n=1 Tax=Streptomyces morookaense TaxID=1970 RepID=A0A7Y7E7N5_STRMO|nr:cytochrome P450 [Streptomyces morookaense]NVK79140.1 cytochrome P450 [Streptomyces morookaense]GHF28245.1 cytochrome P450 [Streptomyces morookaense]